MSPLFLDLGPVLQVQASMIERYGGAQGVRDASLLHSALAIPRAAFGGEFLHRDLFEMAAAYLYHIVENHPFLNGNKRTGTAAAIIFLALNGIELEADEEGLAGLPAIIAQDEVGMRKIADFFRRHAGNQVPEPARRPRAGSELEFG